MEVQALTLRDRLQADLLVAMKRRDQVAAGLLRTLLGSFHNAEAVELTGHEEMTIGKRNDVPRRHLTENDLYSILRKEYAERIAALADYDRHGAEGEKVERFRQEVELLSTYLA